MQIQVEKNHHGVIISVSSRLQKKEYFLLDILNVSRACHVHVC